MKTDLVSRIVKRVLRETHEESNRYMFFSNLQQMRRQCDMLLDIDHSMIEGILENGHDWAQDHISEAKNNMDQVFDFLMNETKKDGMSYNDDTIMMEGRKNEIDCQFYLNLQFLIHIPFFVSYYKGTNLFLIFKTI